MLIAAAIAAGCSGTPWNNPHPASEAGANILYTSFSERPKHLDPVQSYSEYEYTLIANIYQPPLQYHYFKRPYELVPFGATSAAAAVLRRNGRACPIPPMRRMSPERYVIRIRPGILQPHRRCPGLQGRPVTRPQWGTRGVNAIGDFKQKGTRDSAADTAPVSARHRACTRCHAFDGRIHRGRKEIAAGRQSGKSGGKAARRSVRDLRATAGRSGVLDSNIPHPVRGNTSSSSMAGIDVSSRSRRVGPLYRSRGWGENISLDWFSGAPPVMHRKQPNRQMVLERIQRHGEVYPGRRARGRAGGPVKDAGKPLPSRQGV